MTPECERRLELACLRSAVFEEQRTSDYVTTTRTTDHRVYERFNAELESLDGRETGIFSKSVTCPVCSMEIPFEVHQRQVLHVTWEQVSQNPKLVQELSALFSISAKSFLREGKDILFESALVRKGNLQAPHGTQIVSIITRVRIDTRAISHGLRTKLHSDEAWEDFHNTSTTKFRGEFSTVKSYDYTQSLEEDYVWLRSNYSTPLGDADDVEDQGIVRRWAAGDALFKAFFVCGLMAFIVTLRKNLQPSWQPPEVAQWIEALAATVSLPSLFIFLFIAALPPVTAYFMQKRGFSVVFLIWGYFIAALVWGVWSFWEVSNWVELLKIMFWAAFWPLVVVGIPKLISELFWMAAIPNQDRDNANR